VSVQPALGARGAMASALTAAADWLVAPAECAPEAEAPAATLRERPVVAVMGLTPRCGATTVARAVGVELAVREPAGATAVTCSSLGGAVPLGLPAAGRLARTLAPVAEGRTRACGRLCLVDCSDRAGLAAAVLYLAPLVIDTAAPEEASAAAALADTVILVAAPQPRRARAGLLERSRRHRTARVEGGRPPGPGRPRAPRRPRRRRGRAGGLVEVGRVRQGGGRLELG